MIKRRDASTGNGDTLDVFRQLWYSLPQAKSPRIPTDHP